MSEYKDGAENVPLRQINRNMPILVLVYNTKTDDLVKEFKMNYADIDDRKHLGRITFWAVTNHCSVETMAISDVDHPIEGHG